MAWFYAIFTNSTAASKTFQLKDDPKKSSSYVQQSVSPVDYTFCNIFAIFWF
jgi:hypothetical protein